MEDLLDGVVRERLKDVLRQYERRERHFEAVVRSKELEVLLARARVEEQKGCVDVARRVARAAEQQVSWCGRMMGRVVRMGWTGTE